MSWDYFPEKAYWPKIGIKILERINSGEIQRKTMYRVRFLCCGKTVERSHKWIADRIRKRNRMCLDCAREAQKNIPKPKKILLPNHNGQWRTDWPAPPGYVRQGGLGAWRPERWKGVMGVGKS